MPLPRPAHWTTALAVAPGLLLAPLVVATPVILVLLTLGTFIAGLVRLLLSSSTTDGDQQLSHADWLAALGPALTVGLELVSLVAVTTVSPWSGVVLLLVLLVCTPSVRARLRGLLPGTEAPHPGGRARPVATDGAAAPTSSHGSTAHDRVERPFRDRGSSHDPRPPGIPRQRGTVPGVEHLPALTNAELGAAWRASFEVLQRARSPLARVHVVDWRHACLDEIESRDSSALASWLASAPTASGGPEPFGQTGREPAP